MPEIQQTFLELIEFYREHPIVALKELLNVDLAIPQRILFRSMWFNKFVIITAGRGTGKCVAGGTLVPTSKGIFRIEDLGSKLNPVDEVDYNIIGFNGLDKATKWYYDGVQPINKITTNFGYNISCTDEHKIKILNNSGELKWKHASDVSDGDIVAIERSKSIWSDIDRCSEDEAILTGLLVGDGCFRGNKYHLSMTSGDEEIRDFYSKTFFKLFGFYPRVADSSGTRCPSCISTKKSVWSRLEEIGLVNNTKSSSKFIPKGVLRSSKKVVSAFLRGLFEADGGCEKYTVSYCTNSKRLAEEIHVVLLNFGIISKLRKKPVKYKDEIRYYYIIDISSYNVDMFRKEIGFISARKNRSLDSLCGKKRNPNVDVLYNNTSNFLNMWNNSRGVISSDDRSTFRKYGRGYYNPGYESIKKCLKLYPFSDVVKSHLSDLVDRNYFYDIVSSKEKGLDYVYDFVVPGSHSFVANGFVNHNTFLCGAFAALRAMLYPGTRIGLLAPSFRQSKLQFEEVKGIWNKSDILRESTSGRPTMQSDRCVLNFRVVGNTPQSLIEADPLGTGEKIRGLRMHVLLIDEFAQMPPDIFDSVVKPMAATSSSPMENVRRIEKINRLKDVGFDTTDMENTGVSNKIIMVSSAFYKFNHMYKRIEEYERFMESDKVGYDVQYVNYRDMPAGFMNQDIIEEAQATMPASLFRMEYEAIWESDSDGIFKASLLEKCMIPAGMGDTVSLVGKKGKSYVLGCDPAATTDEFAIVVIEVGEVNKVVNAYTFQKQTMPKMADMIIGICERYNVIKILMDSQGGGHAVKDNLADTKYKDKAIIDPEDEEYIGANGRRILTLVNPSPRFNTEANYATLSLLEQGKMFFVGRPLSGKDEEERAYENISKLINQMMNIVVTETRAGVTHFDVPKGGGHGVQKKDLYSAMIYACSNIYEVGRNTNPESNILWGSGVVVPLSKNYSNDPVTILTSPAAILHKK